MLPPQMMTSTGSRRSAASRRLRVRPLLAGLLIMPLGACYTLVPLDGSVAPQVGERYALHISDQGRARMTERFGPGLSTVEGRMIQVSPSEYALSVFRVEYFGNQGTTWAGESVRIEREQVARVDYRRLSRKRTWFAAGAATAVLGYFIFSRGLLGFYTGDQKEPTIPEPESSIGLTRMAR